MKFNIFSLSEKYYKIVTMIIVVVVTISCFVYYYSLDDKSDTFIVSTLYATFTFIVGLYLSYKSSTINDKIYERKSCYITLLRLEELFSSICMTSIVSNKDAALHVITFQVFTGRIDKEISNEEKKKAVIGTVALNTLMEHKPEIDITYTENGMYSQIEGYRIAKEKHYINEIGFKFTKKLQRIEDEFLNLYRSIKSQFEDIVNTYISENNIQLTIYRFNEWDLLDTDYESWCEKYIKEESRDKKEGLIEFIYKTIGELQEQFNDLESKKFRLIKYYKKCNDHVQKNLKRMKATYGNKLEYIINAKDDVMIELKAISQRLDDIERLISNGTTTEEIYERLEYCNKSVDGLYDKLLETEENLINAMDTMQITLENELNHIK